MTQVNPTPLAYLILTNGRPGEWSAVLDQQRKVIGRSRQCDICLPSRFPRASRRHAEIFNNRRELTIRDLGSRSGTHVNGVWIEANRQASLVPGDRIWMGGVQLDVVTKLPAANSSGPEPGCNLDETAGNRIQTLPQPTQLLLAELSHAELAIVLWIGRGYFKDEEIAQKLCRSPHTVRTQINSIFRKLNVHSRADIIGFLKSGH